MFQAQRHCRGKSAGTGKRNRKGSSESLNENHHQPKIRQQIANLEHLSDVIAPENWFALYFLGFLQYKSLGKIDTAVIERLSKQLDSSEFWRDRFSAFDLFLDDLETMEFSNRYIPGLLPKGYTQPLVA